MVMGCVFFSCVASGQDSNSSGYGDSGASLIPIIRKILALLIPVASCWIPAAIMEPITTGVVYQVLCPNTQGFVGSVDANQTGFADREALLRYLGRHCLFAGFRPNRFRRFRRLPTRYPKSEFFRQFRLCRFRWIRTRYRRRRWVWPKWFFGFRRIWLGHSKPVRVSP